ncbi:hypothetical protein B0H11DRAFT_1285061 [Mycena galericulata]|nr:hypothetical protein B0H11DRAFT_1285061 [Mycena galericulata]
MNIRRFVPRQDSCALLDTEGENGPCAVSNPICNDPLTEQCSCSNISYLLDAACSSCLDAKNLSWAEYAQNYQCGALPQALVETGAEAIPLWALAMASATPTPTSFNLAAAVAFVTISSTITSSTPVFSASTHSSPQDSATSFSGVSTTGTITSVPTNPVASKEPNSADRVRGTFPIGVIVGIVLGFCVITSLAVLLLWLRRRRHRRRQQHKYADLLTTPYPILRPDIATTIPSNSAENSDVHSVTKLRQQYLQNELRATQEKVTRIQNMERRVSSARGSAPRRIIRLFSARNGAHTGSESDAMARLRAQNETFAARIRELETQMESPWALGISDEPPPGYSEGDRA